MISNYFSQHKITGLPAKTIQKSRVLLLFQSFESEHNNIKKEILFMFKLTKLVINIGRFVSVRMYHL
jgi:hypothetical protein